MPGGILAPSHVSGVTNPSCPCSHDAAGRERLWIISALSPGGDLTLKLQVSVLHKESVKPSSGSRSCSESLALPVCDIAAVRPPQVTDRQTEENAAQNQCLWCCSCCWPPLPWDFVLGPPFTPAKANPSHSCEIGALWSTALQHQDMENPTQFQLF